MPNPPTHIVHGPRPPQPAVSPLVLDSPHSGVVLPDDFDSIRSADELRDGEDCFIDQLYLPATKRGVPLLAAQVARTYLDPNRHAGDIDLDLLAEPWPHDRLPLQPSGKARLGKALLWRTLDDGRPLYDRKLSVEEVLRRIERVHRPYHAQLQALLDAAHARFGRVMHINCHSMNAVGGSNGEGPPGQPRADVVLGDRDGSSCDPRITAFVADFMAARGYSVKINDPFKGVELVRAFSNPAAGRHSLQIEVNKRLYMHDDRVERHAVFDTLQSDLMALLAALADHLTAGSTA